MVGVTRSRTRASPRRGTRRRRIALGAVIVVVVLAGVFVERVVIHPQIDPVVPADAVVVLGGYGDDTVALGQQILADGKARQLIVSNPYDTPGLGRDTGVVNLTTKLCADPPEHVSCFVPEPSRTIGEAERIRDLGAAQGWQRVTVVTGLVHVSRARYIVEQCWSGGLTVTSPPNRLSAGGTAWQSIYQAFGFARAFVDRGC